jgi:MarR family transcriptional regulator, organic hydroperoxide resistance regulator
MPEVHWQLPMNGSATDNFLAGFDALAQAVRRARGANSADGGLTLSQYGLLEGLAHRRAARVQELAAAAGISASTATRILDALERRGIVRRTRSNEDRRAVSVSLTELGEELLHAEEDWLRGRQRTFYASLPPAEQALAPDLLLRLAALIDELAAGPECAPVPEPPHQPARVREAAPESAVTESMGAPAPGRFAQRFPR